MLIVTMCMSTHSQSPLSDLIVFAVNLLKSAMFADEIQTYA